MRFSKPLVILSALLLLSTAFAEFDDLKEQDCSKTTSCADCMNSKNNDILDATKCMPLNGATMYL